MPGASLQRPTRVRWVVFALACLVGALLYVHRYSWGVIKADVKQEFALSDSQLGWLDSAFNASYTLCLPLAGYLSDRLGPARMLPGVVLLWSAMLAAIGLASGVWSLAALRLGFGGAQSGAFPNLSKLTRSWYPPEFRTSAQGAIGVTAGRVGAACAPLVVSTLLLATWQLSWRNALVVVASAGVALAILLKLVLRDTPAQHARVNEAERRLIGEESAIPGAAPLLTWSREPAVLVSLGFLVLHGFTSAFADLLFVNWIPLYLEEAKGLDKASMGVFASLPLWAGAAGGIAGGMLNDLVLRRTGNLRAARTSIGLAGKLLSAVLIAASLAVPGGEGMMVVVAVAKFFTDWSVPTLWGAITDLGGRAAGRVFGLVNAVSAAGGIVAGPLIGWTKQTYGWPAVFWLIASVYVVSGLAWLGVDSRRKLVS